jgi:hypothetical protein
MEMDACATRWHHPYGPRHIPEDWTLRPDFHFCPPPPLEAGGTIVATGAHGGLPNAESTAIVPPGLYGFSPPSRWKAFQRPARRSAVGNYLDIL